MLGAVHTRDADIEVVFGAPVKTNAGEESYIGLGYDLVNGSCFSKELLKDRVFYPRGNTVQFERAECDDVSFSIVEEKSKVTESIAASMKLNMSFGIFKGELNAAYDESSEDSSDSLYAVASYYYKRGVEKYEYGGSINLKNDGVLDPAFKQAINDFSVHPSEIVSTYGTHALSSGVVRGARLNYYLKTSNTKHLRKEDIKAGIKAKFGKAFGVTGNFEMSKECEEEVNKTDYKFLQVGGLANEKLMALCTSIEGFNTVCETWKKSLENPDMGREIAAVGSVVPLWELADDPIRRKQLEAYMTRGEEIGGVFIPDNAFAFYIDYIPNEGVRINKNYFKNLKQFLRKRFEISPDTSIVLQSPVDPNMDAEALFARDFPNMTEEGQIIDHETAMKYFYYTLSNFGRRAYLIVKVGKEKRISSETNIGGICWGSFLKEV